MDQLQAAARDGATIVTANQRLARRWRRRYDECQSAAGLRAWAAPKTLAWPAFVESLWFEAVLSGSLPTALRLNADQLEAVWRGIIEQAPESRDILQPRNTALSAMSAWSLLQQHGIPWKKLNFGGHEDWTAFTAWARAYERRCTSQNWIDDARIPSAVTEAVKTGGVPLPPRLLLGGFDEFTPQQTILLETLAGAGCPWERVASESLERSVARVEALDSEAELRAAARWSRYWLDAEPGNRIGVVIPDLESRLDLVERVFTEVLHPDSILSFGGGRARFHISLGRPLSSWPLVHAAFLALKLTRPMLLLAEAGAILRSPYLQGSSEAAARAMDDARLRRGRPAEVPTASIDRHGLSRIPLPREQTASGWASTINTLLEKSKWAENLVLNSVEFQSLEAWKSLLRRFSSLDVVRGPMTFDTALSRLGEMAAATEFQPEDPDASIQVTGALEAAGSTFDHLWVAGLDRERWPQPARAHPFLPPSLQIEYSLPHCSPEREFEFARRTTERLLASAPDVVVSHAQREGERTLRPSVLIAGIAAAAPPQAEDVYQMFLQRRSVLETLPDHSAPPLGAQATPGGTSLLKSQAQCPFRAFAEVRLGARALDEGALGIDPLERGNALHKALELFWKEVRTHANLTAMAPAELARAIHIVARASVASGTQTGELDRRFHTLEVERVERVLADWLNIERNRAPFEVIRVEERQPVTISGVDLMTRIDRVDRLDSGEFVIIDYKSNAPSAKAWENERLEEPQLPLYATTLDDPLAALAFAQLTPGDLKFRGLAQSDVLPGVKPLRNGERLADRIQEWRRVIEGLAREFREGHAAVQPTKSACAWCRLTALCRIHEQGVETGENGDA